LLDQPSTYPAIRGYLQGLRADSGSDSDGDGLQIADEEDPFGTEPAAD
jgi:hypothetical protein